MAAQLSLDLQGYELIHAVRSAARLTHKSYGDGLTPVKHCLSRLFDREVMAVSRLLACTFAPKGLKDAVIAEQPERIAARKRDLSKAILFELEQFGCILLESNPYHMPQMNPVMEIDYAN